MTVVYLKQLSLTKKNKQTQTVVTLLQLKQEAGSLQMVPGKPLSCDSFCLCRFSCYRFLTGKEERNTSSLQETSGQMFGC